MVCWSSSEPVILGLLRAYKRPRSSPTLTPTNPPKRNLDTSLLSVYSRSRRLVFHSHSRRRLFADYEKPMERMSTASNPLHPDKSRRYQRANADCCWKNSEVKALVEFILFHSSEKWPIHHRSKFWEAAANYVKIRAQTELQRSGS